MTRKGKGPLSFACECGTLHGHLTAQAVQSGTHLACYCTDCRAAELFCKQPDPAPGPVGIFQISPDGLVIEAGQTHLAVMRLSPKGMFRWYASCCNSPLATTLKSPKLPFTGFNPQRLTDPEKLGAVVAQGFVPIAAGKHRHRNMGRVAFGTFSRMLASRISGRWKNTPFFDEASGHPMAKPLTLSKTERAALYL